ncbi:MAG: 50S ribosomal protein L19e [Candidatus Diapherotrites archaeon]|nr:50S ribosomal protein L19e [Candidatus Diapherotrites archaeon]
MDAEKAKGIAARLLKTGKTKIAIDPENMPEVGEAITKDDVRQLIKSKAITERKESSHSRGRAKKTAAKKGKGRKKGQGKRKGRATARTSKKENWMEKVRAQRNRLRELRKANPEAVETAGYRKIYKKIKGGYFKGKKYIDEMVLGKSEKA